MAEGRCDCSSFMLLQPTPPPPPIPSHPTPRCRPPPLVSMPQPNLTGRINGPRKQAASAQWRLRIQGRKRNWCDVKIKGKENGRRGKREEKRGANVWIDLGPPGKHEKTLKKKKKLHLCCKEKQTAFNTQQWATRWCRFDCWAWSRSLWTLHILHVPVWVPFGFSSSPPQSENMHVSPVGNSKSCCSREC